MVGKKSSAWFGAMTAGLLLLGLGNHLQELMLTGEP